MLEQFIFIDDKRINVNAIDYYFHENKKTYLIMRCGRSIECDMPLEDVSELIRECDMKVVAETYPVEY